MSIGILTLAIVALAMASTARAAQGEPTSRPAGSLLLKSGDTILFEGDSLTSRRVEPALDTWPYLRLNNWDITYADRASEWLFCNRPELDLHFRCSAVGGSTIRDVTRRYDPVIRPLKPNWLVMTLGSNDMAQQIPVAEFRSMLEDLCRRLKADSGGRVVWICTKPAPKPDQKDGPEVAFVPYREAAQQILMRYDGIVLDVAPVLARKEAALKKSWVHHTIRSYEDQHLNAVGAEILSTQLLQALGVLTVNE